MALQQSHTAAFAITFGSSSNVDLGHVFNGAASAKVVRLYEVTFLPDPLNAGSSSVRELHISRYTATPTGGTTVQTEKHESASNALDANTSAGWGKTVTEAALLRKLQTHAATPGSSVGAIYGHVLTAVPYGVLWDAGLRNDDVQPLTCPAGSACGYGIFGATYQGGALVDLVFTSESS